ncbi:PHP domain-containing protein [Alcaligenes endophyticus]|uniref:PHP domain-containing protein n=1 Tax=Alcaligenes endophyticus TaxID=1929088 RepID=A0ABT8EIK9_9BURK|nr:PHP domain-containing protein [Alcaligenes endophyticus]MCX5592377.1 PHP domain-containing protein [Alcaligenes endophyticus]MDN4121102.1 PHP domain-containing protein [Alcaligenes endophyticus]
MTYLKVDLHCHSTRSDGVLLPEQVATRAYENGVQMWALTDHDELSGIPSARSTAEDLGMRFINGVEISTTWAGITVHIVGLNFDAEHPALRDNLDQLRTGRLARAHRIAEALAEQGVEGAYEGALKFAANPAMLSRTHFARYLVQAGYCEHIQQAFNRWLADGKPASVPMQWATLEQAVSWIRAAGGVAVIAHPGRYKYTALQFQSLFEYFKELGGVGIEVLTGSHTLEDYKTYAKVAKHYGFLVSCGSDFHGPSEGQIDLGHLPPLPEGLTPIWKDWW